MLPTSLADHPSASSFTIQAATVHDSARRTSDGIIETSPLCWAYALHLPLPPAPASNGDLTVVVTLDVHVVEGCVGVGCLDASGAAFSVERLVNRTSEPRRVVLRVDAVNATAVIVRNARRDGSSRFQVVHVEAHHTPRRTIPYAVHIGPRDFDSESVPEEGRVVFDDNAAEAINAARIAFVRSLELPLKGCRVLDVGAGVGHFSGFYASLGATVVAVEGRSGNVGELRRRYPDIEAHVGDVQDMDLTALGRFDVVHCFGLLYHLDSPVAALRRLERVCSGVLLLETMVCDSPAPVMVLADETKAVNQALGGLGCRPSPSFVVTALNRVGFGCVYGAASPPAHPDFQFEWRNSLEVSRHGRNLRCVFVASHAGLDVEALVPIVET